MKNREHLDKLKVAANQNIKERDYWLKQMADPPAKCSFPIDYKNNEKKPINPGTGPTAFKIEENLFSSLMRLSNEDDYILHMILAAGLSLLLNKYTGTRDIILGTPIYKQEGEGDFINTVLPLRSRLHNSMTFKGLLLQVKKTLMEAVEHQNYPIELLVNKLNMNGEGENFPLFDIALLMENIHSRRYIEYVKPNFLFSFKRTPRHIAGSIDYNTALYKEDTVKRISLHFMFLLQEVLANIDKAVGAATVLSKEEKRRLIFEFNNTQKLPQKEEVIQELFERQAAKSPGKIAAEFNGQELTYDSLNQYANRLAYWLRRKGVTRDSIAALMVEPSLEMVVGIIAILKAGGAYLSVDPAFPQSRILHILKDSGVSLLLTVEKSIAPFRFTDLQGLKGEKTDIMVTPPREAIRDLDRLPIPDRSLVDYAQYHKHIGNAPAKHTISLLGSRGCPYRCVFCHKIWPNKHFSRSAENIFKEISISYEAGIRRFVFLDDIFNFDIKNSSRLLEKIINRQMGIQLFFPNGLRGDLLTHDYIDLLAAAGAVNIDLALETASPRLQRMMGKNLNLEKFRKNIDYITKKYPFIILELELMIGFPTETAEEALSTYELLKNIKWVHFPNLNILKIYPNTAVSRIALQHGITGDLINRSSSLAYHEIPGTLPFSKEFALEYQARFFSEYFLSKERLQQVLPAQMKGFTEDELVKKYNSYMPVEVKCFNDLLDFFEISAHQLGNAEFLQENRFARPDYPEKIKKQTPVKKENPHAFRLLLLDNSQLFSPEAEGMLYDVIEAPLGLMYLLTYLNKKLGPRINGKIAKSRIDFDSFRELKQKIDHFSPQLIGIRTLTFYKDFFHKTVSMLKQWYPGIPIVTGGPYATSDYTSILSDWNVDAAVLGEGEMTFTELVEKMIENQGKWLDESTLKEIAGLAFLPKRQTTLEKAVPKGREILFINQKISENFGHTVDNPQNINHPRDLAYLLYTSGSTGNPKGVAMGHRSLVNLMDWHFRQKSLSQNAITLQFASFCFDVSFQEIFSTLCSGGKLIVLSKKIKQDIAAWLPLIKKKKIERMFIPFSVLQQFVVVAEDATGYLSSLRDIITAGEQLRLTPSLIRLKKKLNHCTLHNHYGPTETHVVTSCTLNGEITQWPTLPPIGKPIHNTLIYLLDQSRKPVPIGAAGELCIGGNALARGYLNRPEPTFEKFIPAPHNHRLRLYRTGDMANWLPDGNIEFLGRTDGQVKIRGFRVELGEIEHQLLHHDKITGAAAAAKEDKKGDRHLCAYFISDVNISVSELRSLLSERLPDHMIPSYFERIDRLPLTAHGKVDRKALPDPGLGKPGVYVAPQDEVEEKLVEIWSEVLGPGEELIGVDTTFFALGGHSLKVTMLLARIFQKLHCQITLEQIFKTPTIRGLSRYIKGTASAPYVSLEIVEKKTYYELSSAQKRIYILQQADLKSTNYNMPSIYTLKGKLHRKKFEKTFKSLFHRHEALRVSFFPVKVEPVQRIENYVRFRPGYKKLGTPQDVGNRINEFVKPFDLNRAPLLRVELLELTKENYYILFDIHHIISDGSSMQVLINDLARLYNGEDLSPLPVQYKDYAAWQNQRLNEEKFKKQEKYWLKKLDGFIFTQFPVDFFDSYHHIEGKKEHIKIEFSLYDKIEKFCVTHNITKFVFMISAFKIALAKGMDQTDITIGIPVSIREHPDLKDLIGIFLNVLLIRTIFDDEDTFSRHLSKSNKNLIDDLNNQDYPYEMLDYKITEIRENNRPGNNELFSILFNYFPLEKNQEISGGDFHIRSIETPEVFPKYDITIYLFDAYDYMTLSVVYKSNIYNDLSIKKLLEAFLKVIERGLKDENMPISQLTTPDEEEDDEFDDEFEKYYNSSS